MVDARFFQGAEEANDKVQSGEISGFVQWPLDGTAKVDSLAADYKNGVPYLLIKLQHSVKGMREFALRIPQAQDKDTAKFMGMQKIYGTVYPIGKSTPGTHNVQAAFARAQENAGAMVKFRLEEYESFSEKHGKYFTNQSLTSLELVEGETEGEFA